MRIRPTRYFLILLNLIIAITLMISLNIIHVVGYAQDTEEWVELQRFGNGWIKDIALSPNGNTLAVETSLETQLYDMKTLEMRGVLPITANSVNWSPDSKRLVFGGADSVYVWDSESIVQLGFLNFANSDMNPNMMSSVSWSPDGRQLAAVATGYEHAVWLWDDRFSTERGAWVFDSPYIDMFVALRGPYYEINDLEWSPDSYYLAFATQDNSIYIWNVENKMQFHILQGHEGAVLSLAWSPDSKRLASTGNDATIRIWDVTEGQEIDRFEEHSGNIRDIVWSPDSTRLASAGDDQTIRVWDIATGTQEFSLSGHTAHVSKVLWTLDGGSLISTGLDNTVRIWDIAAGHQSGILNDFNTSMASIDWSPDGTKIVTANDNFAQIWNVEDRLSLLTLSGHTRPINNVDWSPDGSYLASASDDATIRVWDAATGEELKIIQWDESAMVSVIWSPDSHQLAFANANGSVWIQDTQNESLSPLRLEGHSSRVNNLAWSLDGKRLASASSDNSVRIWDTTTGTESFSLIAYSHGEAVAWSSDNLLAYGDGEGQIRLWSEAGGEQPCNLPNWSESIESIAWSPDSNQLAWAYSTPSTAYSGIEIMNKNCQGRPSFLSGHQDTINTVMWSPDGLRIASASDDGTVRIWGLG